MPLMLNAQEWHLQFREPAALVVSLGELIDKKLYKQYQITLGGEYIFPEGRFSVILNPAYSFATQPQNNNFEKYGEDPSKYYQEAFAFGAFGRLYAINKNFKLYTELGGHYHRSMYNHVIMIDANYGGVYEKHLSGAENIWSATACIGVSLPMFWGIRYEPYFQFNVHSLPDSDRVGDILFGTGNTYIETSPNTNLFLWPFSFKIQLAPKADK